MYLCQLNINLVRCPAEIMSVLEDAFPPARFSFNIRQLNELTTQTPTDPRDYLLVICPAKIAEGKVDRLCRLARNQWLVVLSDTPQKLSVELLAIACDVWPQTLTVPLAQFYLDKIVAALKAEKDAWLEKNYLDTVINMLPDLVWFKDISGCHLDVNDAFCEAVDKPKSDVRGHYHYYIWGIIDEELQDGDFACQESETAVIQAGRTCEFAEEVMHAKRGLRQFTTWKSPVFDEAHKIIGTIGVGRDVTEERENQAKILQMAHTDPLTNLANRRYFYDYVIEHRKNNPLVIFYIDLDHFKELNDTYGHQSGDAALLGVSELMRLCFPHDLISRLGGDEFIIAHIGKLGRDEAAEQLEKFRQKAAGFFQLDECMKNLSMSIGVAMTDDPNMTLDSIIMQSDKALYFSKEQGRNRYTFYDEISTDEISTNDPGLAPENKN